MTEAHPWDVYRAELADTMRNQDETLRPCIYCAAPTRSLYRVCLDHHDLIKLDPAAPAANSETA